MYVVSRDEFKEQTLADRQGLIASGRVDDLARLPTVAGEIARFDNWLNSAPETPRGQINADLLRALEVA